MSANKARKVQNKNSESSSSSSSDDNDMKGGGIMDILFGKDISSYVTSLIFDSFQKKMVYVGLFVIGHAIDNNVNIKCNCRDNDGRTLLHWLVMVCSKINGARIILIKMLESTNMKNYINAVDKCKNSVGHYAVYLNQPDLIDLFVKYGLDLSLKNDTGLKVSVNEKYTNESANVFAKRSDSKELIQASDKLDKLVDKLVKQTETDEDTINFNRNTVFESDTQPIKNNNEKNKQAQINKQILDNIMNSFAKINDSELDRMNNQLDRGLSDANPQEKSQENPGTMFGGNVSDGAFIVENIYNEFNGTSNDKIANKIIGNYQKSNKLNMKGGSINGTRKMTTYSEMSMVGGTSDDEESSSDDEESENDETDSNEDETNSNESATSVSDSGMSPSELNELAGYATLANLSRENNNKDDHEIIVQKIKENLKLKDDLEAKAYKAIIYKDIKEKNPGMKYDERTVELDKRASDKKYLESLTKSADKKKIDEIIAYLKDKNTEQKKEEKKKDLKKENGSKRNADPFTSD
jgi:hypothetical protein